MGFDANKAEMLARAGFGPRLVESLQERDAADPEPVSDELVHRTLEHLERNLRLPAPVSAEEAPKKSAILRALRAVATWLLPVEDVRWRHLGFAGVTGLLVGAYNNPQLLQFGQTQRRAVLEPIALAEVGDGSTLPPKRVLGTLAESWMEPSNSFAPTKWARVSEFRKFEHDILERTNECRAARGSSMLVGVVVDEQQRPELIPVGEATVDARTQQCVYRALESTLRTRRDPDCVGSPCRVSVERVSSVMTVTW